MSQHERLQGFSAQRSRSPSWMLVVVVAGITMTLALPRIDVDEDLASTRCGGTGTIAAAHAQRQAITRQHDILVSFDTTGERIRTIWDANSDGVADSSEHVSSAWPGQRRALHRRAGTPGVSGDASFSSP